MATKRRKEDVYAHVVAWKMLRNEWQASMYVTERSRYLLAVLQALNEEEMKPQLPLN